MQIATAVVSGFGATIQVDIIGAPMVATKAVIFRLRLVGRSVAEGLQQGYHVNGVAVVITETFVRANFRGRRRMRLTQVGILVAERESTATESII